MKGQSAEKLFFPEFEIECGVPRNDDEAGWCVHDACTTNAADGSLLCQEHKKIAEKYFLGQLCRDPLTHLKSSIPVKATWCWLYFVGSREAGTVKIGITRNLKKRMSTIRNTSAVPVNLLHVICAYPAAESALHHRFKSDRLHGEWFRLSDDINRCIEDLKARRAEVWLDSSELPDIGDQIEELGHVVAGVSESDAVMYSGDGQKVSKAVDMLRNLCLNSQ